MGAAVCAGVGMAVAAGRRRGVFVGAAVGGGVGSGVSVAINSGAGTVVDGIVVGAEPSGWIPTSNVSQAVTKSSVNDRITAFKRRALRLDHIVRRI